MDKQPCNSHDVEVRKGPWTMEEDLILINYIANHGEGVWNSLAKAAGLKRTGKSCRLRWLNYLRPDVRRGNITQEEELLIIELHSKWGNRNQRQRMPQKQRNLKRQNRTWKWSKIAKHLPGRTDNEIKNYWRTRIQKHIKQADQTNNYSAHQSNSRAADHQQASTSHVSGGSVADPMEVYSPPSYPCNTVGTFPVGTFSEQLPMESNEQNYWSLEEIWSLQLLNCD